MCSDYRSSGSARAPDPQGGSGAALEPAGSILTPGAVSSTTDLEKRIQRDPWT
jgi:hypothetical protein